MFGGSNTDPAVVTDIKVYNPISDSWKDGGDLLNARQHCKAATVGNHIYIFGGDDLANVVTDVERYDPLLQSSTAVTTLPFNCSAFVVLASGTNSGFTPPGV